MKNDQSEGRTRKWQLAIWGLKLAILATSFNISTSKFVLPNIYLKGGGGGGGGVQAYHFGKKDFELGVGGERQDTFQNFEGSFGSIRALLPM